MRILLWKVDAEKCFALFNLPFSAKCNLTRMHCEINLSLFETVLTIVAASNLSSLLAATYAGPAWDEEKKQKEILFCASRSRALLLLLLLLLMLLNCFNRRDNGFSLCCRNPFGLTEWEVLRCSMLLPIKASPVARTYNSSGLPSPSFITFRFIG